MSYEFESDNTATFKIKNSTGSTLSLKGINGTNSNADTIITGIQGLLYIVDKVDQYEPTTGIRTVNENVIDAG